jgi:hypothetical protein
MAAKRTLLTRLADTPTPVTTSEHGTTTHGAPTPPAGAPPPDSKLETPPPAAALPPSGIDITAHLNAESDRLLRERGETRNPDYKGPVTDPQLVWANLIRTPQGRSLTDPRIQQLSPQRFDTVFLSALKSAFLAGWDASKEGGEG